jgi:hypothetical protein
MKTELEGYDDINQTGANVFREMFRSKLSWTLRPVSHIQNFM